jgi:hypothetical protein
VGERATALEGEMTEEPRRTHIRLDLSECQKEQIRKATGRRVNSLELRLQGLPEPAESPDREEERTDR